MQDTILKKKKKEIKARFKVSIKKLKNRLDTILGRK